MNLVQFEECAFIFPDDIEAFRKRYGVDIIYVDAIEAVVLGIGPNDKEWRELPTELNGPRLVAVKGDD